MTSTSSGIEEIPFPDAFAILASQTYVFDVAASDREISMRIVSRRRLVNGVDAMAVNAGLLAFNFAGTPLGGFRRLRSKSMTVPEAVMDNEAAMLRLQGERLRMAVFIAACVYGTHAESSHSTIRDPLFPGLGDVLSCALIDEEKLGLAPFEVARVAEQLRQRKSLLDRQKLAGSSISKVTLAKAFDLADRLLAAAPSYATTDPVTLMVLTYQATVLHGLQHPGPSIAVAAVVIEAAIVELLHGLGLVEGRPARLALLDPHPEPMSRRKAKALGFNGALAELKDRGVINTYLGQRIDAVRKARNEFMHEAKEPGARQSGEALTAIRDILRACTGEQGFELNTGFTYRC